MDRKRERERERGKERGKEKVRDGDRDRQGREGEIRKKGSKVKVSLSC